MDNIEERAKHLLQDTEEFLILLNNDIRKKERVIKRITERQKTILNNYEKLKAQISVYAGKRDGGLSTIQDFFHKLTMEKPIICECCGESLGSPDGRHNEDCDIVKEYEEIFGLNK